jgi:integrase
MRTELTQSFIDKTKARPPRKRTIYWDQGMKGFGWQITPAGHVSFAVQYRHGRTSRRYTIKGTLSLKDARREAKGVQGKVAKGHDPVVEERKKQAAGTNTFRAIAEEYLKRDGKKLRSKDERKRILAKYLYPKLGDRQIDDIRRVDIVRLLDAIEDHNGPAMADHVLVVLRKLLNWHAARSDDFRSPIVKGMGRINAKERARSRTLDDRELRAFWQAAETFPGAYGFLLRYILLCACRLREASNMTQQELSGDVWAIPSERHKSKKSFELPLSQAAKNLLSQIPRIAGEDWLFTHNGQRPIGGFSKFKKAFDAKMLAELHKEDSEAEMKRWVVHDLRRTARSLMSRAGVPPRHAEMALGHVSGGVEAVYDRHRYFDEKREAFEALSSLIARILNPQENVVALRGAG